MRFFSFDLEALRGGRDLSMYSVDSLLGSGILNLVLSKMPRKFVFCSLAGSFCLIVAGIGTELNCEVVFSFVLLGRGRV